MINCLPLFIGLRYIRSRERSGYLSFISLLSFLAMALGVAALILVLSVMNGFDGQIRHRILNVVPHITVLPRDGQVFNTSNQELAIQSLINQLTNSPGIAAGAPYVSSYGLLSSDNAHQGVLIQGIDPTQEASISQVHQFVRQGSMDSLNSGGFGIVIGGLLAQTLGVGVGDTVVLSLPELMTSPAGVFPRYKRFTVKGIFQVGAQVDNGLVFIHVRDGQKLLRLGKQYSGIRLRSEDPFQVNEWVKHLTPLIPSTLKLTTWTQDMRQLFQAIEMEKKVVGILLSAIIAVAAFNIVASLVLMVSEKRQDIAVMRTQGMLSRTVFQIFLFQGAIIGFFGVLCGVCLGCLLSLTISDILRACESLFGFQLFDPTVYFIRELPSELRWQDVLTVSILAMTLSVLATLYPAHRSRKILPAEALRYEH